MPPVADAPDDPPDTPAGAVAWRPVESGPWQHASHFIAAGRYDRAIEPLREVLQQEPEDANAHRLLAACYRNTRRKAEAIHHGQESVRLSPEESDHHFELGAVYAAFGQLGKAYDCLVQARQLAPEDAAVAEMLAAIYNARDLPQKARAEALRGLSLDPHSTGCRTELATALHALGESAAAEAITREILAIDPEDRDSHVTSGMGALRRADGAAAEHHFETAMRVDPRHAGADSELRDSYRSAAMLEFAPYRWLRKLLRREDVVGGILFFGIVTLALVETLTPLSLLPVLLVTALVLASIPIVASAWAVRTRDRARRLGREAVAKAGVGIAGLLALALGGGWIYVRGTSPGGLALVAGLAYAMPLCIAWSVWWEMRRLAVLLVALPLALGLLAFWMLLTRPAEVPIDEARSAVTVFIIYLIVCAASYELPRAIRSLRDYG
jgi:Flp pilus assembly protein TadD